jgi:basic amino acid/polyamine antiporter, APA family
MVGVLDAYAPEGGGTRGAPGMQNDLRVMYTLAETLGGHWAGQAMAVLGVLIILSQGNAGVLASSRFPFAMGRDKLVPSIFSRIHVKYMTPTVSIIFTGAVLAVLIVSFDVLKIAKLASSLKIAIFMLVNLCVIIFRESGATWYQPKFRSPLYPWIQIAGISVGAILLYLLGLDGLWALLGMIIPGLFVFAVYGRRHTESRGVLALRAPREELRLEAARALIEHQDILPGEAKVVVAMLGSERSPETLVEIGGALANGSVVDVMHVTDVPEQIMLDSALEEDPVITSLRRRIRALGEELDISVNFDPVVTRDVLRTIHDTTVQVHCGWLVM